MRLAAASVPSNIAEGEESGGSRKAKYYYYVGEGL